MPVQQVEEGQVGHVGQCRDEENFDYPSAGSPDFFLSVASIEKVTADGIEAGNGDNDRRHQAVSSYHTAVNNDDKQGTERF